MPGLFEMLYICDVNAPLDELECWAKELGFLRYILETGEKLPEAIRLYQKKGYSRIANYGQYECLGSSVCFE
ncbi:MAG: hypothetical protein LBS79_10100, partial [Tannerella sp.]|nr:hypothetical protein [Tannerella sp.]